MFLPGRKLVCHLDISNLKKGCVCVLGGGRRRKATFNTKIETDLQLRYMFSIEVERLGPKAEGSSHGDNELVGEKCLLKVDRERGWRCKRITGAKEVKESYELRGSKGIPRSLEGKITTLFT